jgi:hypothetical protein
MKNLNYLADYYRLSNGIVSTQYDQQFIQWCVAGLKKMKQMGLYAECVKAVELTIDKKNNTASLPSDYDVDSLIKMGVCKDGIFIQFDKNDYLCTPDEIGCKCPSSTDIAVNMNSCCGGGGEGYPSWIYPIYGQPYSFSYTVNNYAIGPGFYHGGYKIDYAKRLIVFDKCITVDSCIIEYFGSITDDAGNAIISEAMEEVLINYIHYCRCRFSPEVGMRQREAPSAKMTWYQSVRDLNSSQQAISKFHWLDLMRRYTYQGVKS